MRITARRVEYDGLATLLVCAGIATPEVAVDNGRANIFHGFCVEKQRIDSVKDTRKEGERPRRSAQNAAGKDLLFPQLNLESGQLLVA